MKKNKGKLMENLADVVTYYCVSIICLLGKKPSSPEEGEYTRTHQNIVVGRHDLKSEPFSLSTNITMEMNALLLLTVLFENHVYHHVINKHVDVPSLYFL